MFKVHFAEGDLEDVEGGGGLFFHQFEDALELALEVRVAGALQHFFVDIWELGDDLEIVLGEL